MNTEKLQLHFLNYSYFPYELELARREVRSMIGKSFEQRGTTVECDGGWNAKNVWRLTYFSHGRKGDTRYDTLQHQLEKGHLESRGATAKRQATRYSVHGLHDYKGKFNPQVAHALLNILGATSKHLVLDPFCGSGTTLVEAAHLGIRGRGIDINPLAVFVANVKLSALTLPASDIAKLLERALKAVKKSKVGVSQKVDARRAYLVKWFPSDVLATIERLRGFLDESENRASQFLLVIASNLLRDYSLQDPGDLRIRRRKSPLPEIPFLDAWETSARMHIASLEAAQPVLRKIVPPSSAVVADVRSVSACGRPESVDYVITSPPYATALPYIDTQRLSLVWLGLVPPDQLSIHDAQILGSREIRGKKDGLRADLEANSGDIALDAAAFCRHLMKSVGAGDGFRRQATPLLIYRYLVGMKQTFENLWTVLKRGGRMAWVVGTNQTTLNGQRIVIDTPSLLTSIAEQAGFSAEQQIEMQTYHRYGLHNRNSIHTETTLVFHK
jgi:site-specific DNA-methyltransferase (cytosine-N4-specific)